MTKLKNHKPNRPGALGRPRDLRSRMTRLTTVFALAITAAVLTLPGCGSSTAPESDSAEKKEEAPRGLHAKTDGVTSGYVLFAPLLSGTTYLIDEDGKVVHTWESEYSPSGSVYFRDNGNLIRTVREPNVEIFKGGGQGGRIQELSWDGELVWDFVYASKTYLLHHDIEPLPNGNFLLISWEPKTVKEAQLAGRRPELLPEKGIWPDKILEIEPTPPEGAHIVWEWHMWDHLIQDYNKEAANYGDPASKPWRININGDGKLQEIDPAELERLKALGYVPDDAKAEDLSSDLLHTNAVNYNAELDQIVVSTPKFNEIWIIDHSTTTQQAAGSTGGRAGRGGDLLYRWGNPRTYGRGTEADQKLFGQHDVRWVSTGFPGAGHLTVFNNGLKGPEGNYSAVYEIATPLNQEGRYPLPKSGPFGPPEPAWSYTAPDKVSFSSGFISGAQRLANGNTLICAGAPGRFFEVTPAGEIVWDYWTLYSGNIRMPDGSLPHPVGENTYAVFRATKIPPDHPGLAGRDLKPLDPQPTPVKGPEVPKEAKE
jgi:Arylsulfotransferase (ASST)